MQKELPIKSNAKLSSQLVRVSRLFASLPEPRLEEMMEHFRAERWDKNCFIDDKIFQQRFFLIIAGRIEITRTHPESGRSITLDLLNSGDEFSVITLLDGKQHEATITLLEDTNVISAPIEKVREWIWKDPELNRRFMPYLAKKMRAQEDKMTDFALYDTVTRLSKIILKNIDKRNAYKGRELDAHKSYLVSGLSDELLARMVGSVRQVINLHLQHWKKTGIIDKKRNQIKINNLQAILSDAGVTLANI